ncbi:MAG: tetratricopeptide repeat protein [Deltaproteobacteria bacterium]|nr:tetratricopeptide repeat protein [Deltaproteobacteria bacterium]
MHVSLKRQVITISPAFWVALISPILFPGCGAGKHTRVVKYEMEPVVIIGDPKADPALAGPDIAFEHAQELYDRGDSTGSLEYFDQVWKRWPDSRAASLALYNAGLILEELSDFTEALSRYLTVIKTFPGTREAHDARFRAAWCYEKLRSPDKAAAMASKILSEGDLTPDERFDATVRLGIAYFNMGHLDRAESMLTHALSPLGLAGKIGGTDGNPVAAQAQFTLGEIWSNRFRNIKLKLPIENMKKNLVEKCALLLRAQHSYLRAMRIGDKYWATAAAYGIGKLYDDFVDDVIGADLPQGLTEEEKSIYYCELKKYIDVLAKKAIRIYSQNLDMAERMGVTNEWIENAGTRLKDLQERYLDQYGLCRDQAGLSTTEQPAGEIQETPRSSKKEEGNFKEIPLEQNENRAEGDITSKGEDRGLQETKKEIENNILEPDAGSYYPDAETHPEKESTMLLEQENNSPDLASDLE